MKISVLTNDLVTKRGFLAEHGLSLYIEDELGRFVFDTGQTDVFLRNASAMGIDLSKADAVILSHPHYDHTGGAAYLPPSFFPKDIYAREPFFERRFKLDGEREIDSGVPWSAQENPVLASSLVFTGDTSDIAPGVTLISGLRGKSFEKRERLGFIGANGEEDMMEAEQMLVFNKVNGLYIFLGCAHPGVLGCVETAIEHFAGKKVAAVVGGMHLSGAPALRVKATAQSLADLNVGAVAPLHCSGLLARFELKREFRANCVVSGAGETFEL